MEEKMIEIINLRDKYKMAPSSFDDIFRGVIAYNKNNNLNLDDMAILDILRDIIVSMEYYDESSLLSEESLKNQKIRCLAVDLISEINEYQKQSGVSDEEVSSAIRTFRILLRKEPIVVKDVDTLIVNAYKRYFVKKDNVVPGMN